MLRAPLVMLLFAMSWRSRRNYTCTHIHVQVLRCLQPCRIILFCVPRRCFLFINSFFRELLDLGADIDHTEREGWTALMFACANGHERTAQLLLSRGANASLKSVKGSDARELALEYAHVDAVVSARIVAMLWKYDRAAKAAAAGDQAEKPNSFFGSFW